MDKEWASATKKDLAGIVEMLEPGYCNRWTLTEIDNIKEAIEGLAIVARKLVDVIDGPIDTKLELHAKHLPLNPAPFQPECRCIVGRQNDNSIAIYHCDYHRSIDFIHNSLKALLIDISMETSKNELRETIRADIAFLDRCKEKSLTGRIGKARDENVGR